MRPIVIQSHGLGVESQAILERWCVEPESRPFDDWSQLIVITAQVGEEHTNDTIRHAEARMLPLLKNRGVRFVEVARRGPFEEDGIVVLQDTRSPEKLHPEGVYRLSDELLRSGTVPQFGGEHRCAMKFKAFVIESWLAFEFQRPGKKDIPVFHVFGYNADEVKRIEKSDHHISIHNADRQLDVRRPPLMVFGFNSEEGTRIERAKKYDGPSRTGLYPLQEWGWGRQKCIDYIKEVSGIDWRKSHCSFCPFCAEAAKGQEEAVQRWREAPEQTAHGLFVEFNSMCFNPRGILYKTGTLKEQVEKAGVTEVLDLFQRKLKDAEWSVYRVRRIYTAKGKAVRCVEKLPPIPGDMRKPGDPEPCIPGSMERAQIEVLLYVIRSGMPGEIWRDIAYYPFVKRGEDYPSREGFYVAAPSKLGDKLLMETKVRGPIEKFNERWDRVGQGLPMNPTSWKATHRYRYDRGVTLWVRLSDCGKFVETKDGSRFPVDENSPGTLFPVKPKATR